MIVRKIEPRTPTGIDTVDCINPSLLDCDVLVLVFDVLVGWAGVERGVENDVERDVLVVVVEDEVLVGVEDEMLESGGIENG